MFHTAYFHYVVISLLPLLCGVQSSASPRTDVDTAVTVRYGPTVDHFQMGFVGHLAALGLLYTTTTGSPVLECTKTKH